MGGFGIQPIDSLQDVVLESVETSADPALAGVSQYSNLLAEKKFEYHVIGVSFDQYRMAGRDPRTIRNLNGYADRKPTFGPPVDGIDFSKPPRSVRRGKYDKPIYKGETYKPIIPLAIIGVAEKNLPFVDFNSALNHLPNLGPEEKYPLWRDDIDFIDEDMTYTRKAADNKICIVFLPDYYIDGRHCVGFYTRKLPSERLGTILFTPCTAADLKAAKLWMKFNGREEHFWQDVLVGVGDGTWYHNHVVEQYDFWKTVLDVEEDWKLRLRVAIRTIEESSELALRMDNGRVAEDWWE
ncbi:hypothetical protein K458DRAFT_311195 [Lentithecium fluviatile CBS 122367]|uniref:Uncharacterized protein n=1 Tax=Lentithecium fluviatile CBS 122367 TaxID=1168545 RepID=A0A6G1IRU7_9PLEO|nr:hypothetical protein K458DRAFT_311195 [Lentithecium fluviatile CBS 122367]